METLSIFRIKWIAILGMVFLLPLLGGCQDDGLPDQNRTLDDAYALIVGEWDWVKSLLVNRRQDGVLIQTPESEGTNKQFVFGRDRTMRIIENGMVVRDSEFYMEAYENSFGLKVVETGARLVVSFKADTLIVSNPAFGDAYHYIRK
jgi:hypothetical protein